MRIAGYGLEYQNWVAEIKIRAERKAGEMLNELIPASGGRPRKNLDPESKFSDPPTLAGLGITYTQSRRWRKEASLREDIFNLYVAAVKLAGDELTSAGVLRLAEHLQQGEQGFSDDFNVSFVDTANSKADRPSPLLYKDQWLRVWDAEAETGEPYVLTENTMAFVVTDGVKARYYILEAVRGFILTSIKQ